MSNEIQLISDGHGLAVIGHATDVERFLAVEGLPSKDMKLQRLTGLLQTGAGAAQAGSQIAQSTGRWVKLSAESAEALQRYPLMKGSDPTLRRAVLMNNNKTAGILEIVKSGPTAPSPAFMAGAGGLMAQMAMQQAMTEITDYLDTINEKVDDILRAQKDAVLADMVGVDFVIEEAMTIREEVGRVSEVTWSKVQATSTTVGRTQAYALLQLKSLAEKLEAKASIADLTDAAREVEAKVQEWLAVLAFCFRLQDAIAVLELDRVLDSSPAELDQHRLALRTARNNRLARISRTTEDLMARVDAAATRANSRVLLNPIQSPAVVQSGSQVVVAVENFRGRLGIEQAEMSLQARRWRSAAADARDKALETGADGVDTALRLGNETLGRARSVTGRVSSGIAARVRRSKAQEDESSRSEEI